MEIQRDGGKTINFTKQSILTALIGGNEEKTILNIEKDFGNIYIYFFFTEFLHHIMMELFVSATLIFQLIFSSYINICGNGNKEQ